MEYLDWSGENIAPSFEYVYVFLQFWRGLRGWCSEYKSLSSRLWCWALYPFLTLQHTQYPRWKVLKWVGGAAGARHPWDRGRCGHRQPLWPTASPHPNLALQNHCSGFCWWCKRGSVASLWKCQSLWRTCIGMQISRSPGESDTLFALLSTGPQPTKVSRSANIGSVLEFVWVSS